MSYYPVHLFVLLFIIISPTWTVNSLRAETMCVLFFALSLTLSMLLGKHGKNGKNGSLKISWVVWWDKAKRTQSFQYTSLYLIYPGSESLLFSSFFLSTPNFYWIHGYLEERLHFQPPLQLCITRHELIKCKTWKQKQQSTLHQPLAKLLERQLVWDL